MSQLFDISDDFFKCKNYEIKYLQEFDNESITDLDKHFNEKPQREEVKQKIGLSKKIKVEKSHTDEGYCIRTGVQIPYNPERPFCLQAYKKWSKYENPDFPENYCHKTGVKSNGKTSFSKPIL